MTTIREEINKISFDLYNYGVYSITGNKFEHIHKILVDEQHQIKQYTNEVIKVFEKLINEKIQDVILFKDNPMKKEKLEELKEELTRK